MRLPGGFTRAFRAVFGAPEVHYCWPEPYAARSAVAFFKSESAAREYASAVNEFDQLAERVAANWLTCCARSEPEDDDWSPHVYCSATVEWLEAMAAAYKRLCAARGEPFEREETVTATGDTDDE